MSAATAIKPEAIVPVEQPHALKPTHFSGAEFAFATFSAVLPTGWTYEDALKPEFWVHVASKFAKNPMTGEADRAGAVIELRTEDHAFYARLYVRAVQERGLIVAPLGEPIYFGLKAIKSKGYRERWNSGKKGFDIIRQSDNIIVVDGDKIKTREQAQAWIDEAMRAI